MAYETLIVEKEEGIAVVKLNRPPANPLNAQTYAELYDAFSALENDDSVGAIILTGTGEKFFTAGLDVKEVAGKSVPDYLSFGRETRKSVDKIAGVEKPTIAAVFGFVLGGALELALACDFRITTTDAKIGFTEINLGVIPGSGGTQRLPRLIGAGKAKELLFTGDIISGDEAYRLGIVNKVVDKAALQDEAKAFARKLASKPRVALRLLKTAVDNGLNVDLPTGLTFETECFLAAYVSEDGREGFQSFIEKRKPVFKGK
jgi:enoyl-CoA hydratase